MADACNVCGKGAFALIGLQGAAGVPVCVEHYIQLQAVENEKQRNLVDQSRIAMAMMNNAIDEMDSVLGFGTGGRVRIPEPAPANKFTSVHVANSTIGVVSTEAVGEITAYVNAMPPHDAARDAIAQLTAAVVDAADLAADARTAMLEQIAVISEQAIAEPAKRKGAAVAPLLATIGQTAGAVAALANVWTAVEPILKAHFKIP